MSPNPEPPLDPPAADRPPSVHVPHGRGVQVGDGNTQVNVFIAGTEVTWPVEVGLVPPRADCFQERSEIEALRDAVRSEETGMVTQVLVGLGGVGKSQLAAAFAHDRRAEVDLLVWADARSREAVITSFARVSDRLGLRGRDTQESAKLFLEWLRSAQDRSWLVVLDDVANPADLQGLWPAGRGGSTIVTTRRRDAALTRRRQRIDVGLFSPEQARRYIREKLDVDDGSPRLQDVDLLAEDLQFLPLALAQATAFMLDRNETCTGYRKRFTDRRRMLVELFPADALADDYQATVATTWAISMEAVDDLGPVGLSRPMLEIASVLSPNGFPSEILRTVDAAVYLAAAPSNDASGTRDPCSITETDCRDALSNLVRLSLASVGRSPDGGAFVSVHALVQRVATEHLDPARRHALAWQTAFSMLRCWLDTEDDRQRSQLLRDSTQALLRNTGNDLWVPRQHPLLALAGHSFRNSGFVHAAVDYWQRVYRTSDRVLTSDHPDTLADRHEYAGALGDAGDLEAAITELEQVLVDEIRVLGEDHREILTTRHSIATFQGDAGHFAEALTALEAILPDRVRVFGADNRHTLTTRANIARFRGECGDHAAAIADYNKVIRDRTRVLGAGDRDTLHSRSNLAYWKAKYGLHRRGAREFAEVAADCARFLHPDD